LSEEQLERIQRAKAGDGRAFDQLLSPVLDPAFRLAMTMLNDRAAAEDAVQEAALKMWRNLGSFRPGSEMRPWALAIVANECRNTRRGRWWGVIRSEDIASGSQGTGSERSWADRIDLDAP
jgi:RNA polymerase sigma-70 factor (ECF subfamily)